MRKLTTIALVITFTLGCQTTENIPLIAVDKHLLNQANTFELIEKKTFWHEDKMNLTIGQYYLTNMNVSWRSSQGKDTRLNADNIGVRNQSTKEKQHFTYLTVVRFH